MDKREVEQLLIIASGIDRRQISEPMILAWYDALADMPYPVAVAALREHRRESTEYVQPAHIVARARRSDVERAEAEDREQRRAWLAERGLDEAQWGALVREHGVAAAIEHVESQREIER